MITDRREIRFEAEALLMVLAGSPRATAALGLPPGAPQAVVFDPGTESVRFVWSTAGQRRSESLEGSKLGALLVSFCLRIRVPLPRRASKSIRVEPDMVVLEFLMPVKPDLLSLMPEGRIPEAPAANPGRKWEAGTSV